MPHSYQFRLDITKLATEQDFYIHEVAKLEELDYQQRHKKELSSKLNDLLYSLNASFIFI